MEINSLAKPKHLYTGDYTSVYTMNIENIKRKKNNNKSVLITVRITPEISKWLKKKDYSPTGIFYEAIKELGYKEE